MADLKIKPTTGGSLKLQEDGGTDAISINTSGVSTIKEIASGCIFPAGVIRQCVFAPTLVTDTGNKTSDAVVASATNQITITSGNGVLIYVQMKLYGDRASADMGFTASLRETAAVGGALVSQVHERNQSMAGNWFPNFSLWGYDATPADTTPDYCLSLARHSAGLNYIKLNDTDAHSLKFFLIEVTQ